MGETVVVGVSEGYCCGYSLGSEEHGSILYGREGRGRGFVLVLHGTPVVGCNYNVDLCDCGFCCGVVGCGEVEMETVSTGGSSFGGISHLRDCDFIR